MLRHIVLFKFKDEAEGRTNIENALLTKKMLDALPEKIPLIRHLETNINLPEADRENAELVLVCDFDSPEALAAYQVHPDHVAVGQFMRPLRLSRMCIDFNF